MVHMNVVRSSNSLLVKTQPLVAVFVGGTAGIGESTVRALATTHATEGAGLRLYLVGRKKEAADKILSDCVRICPAGDFRFVKAQDLALLKDVDRVCAEIMQAEEKEVETTRGKARVDILVMTHAYLAFEGRKETKEGLDMRMSLLYYSRMRFIIQLLPLLLASPLPAHVVSVFGPGREAKIFPDDLSQRDPKHYGFMNMGSHVAYFTTLFMEYLAARYPGRLSLTHYYPSLVFTAAFGDGSMPRWFTWTYRCIGPLMKPFTVPVRESGERVLFLASLRYPARSLNSAGGLSKSEVKLEIAESTDGVVGGGHYRVTWNGEVIPSEKVYREVKADGLAERVVNHTMKAFEEIEAERTFTE